MGDETNAFSVGILEACPVIFMIRYKQNMSTKEKQHLHVC